MRAILVLTGILCFLIGYLLGRRNVVQVRKEGYQNPQPTQPTNQTSQLAPDASKWVMRSTIPPCPPQPDMTRYMLKTECPPQPDMSKYVLKSSVPACPPCISTCSKPCKIGQCPPCPRARCPSVKCPDPKPCPSCPNVNVEACPEPNVQCNAKYEAVDNVRPMLASTSTYGY
jgi:hypothetical protein